MKDRGTKVLQKKKKIKIKSYRIFDLAFLQHRVVPVIPERAISAVSVGKFFAEKERNILRQKNRKVRLRIKRICVRLKNVNCEIMFVRLNQLN